MKKILLMAVAMALVSSVAFAAKTTYIVTNKRFNYVKIKEVSGNVAEERRMTHPVILDETGLRAALASVKLSRSFIISKDVDNQDVFDERAINFLAPNLVKAFEKAGPKEKIVFSYLAKNPFFIIRNDRLSICEAWIQGDELHIKFEKLYAKITGDVDKRGNEARAIANARGLRVKLELGEGQKLGIDDTEEIVLDIHHNYVKKPEAPAAPESVTMAGERVETPNEVQTPAPEIAAKGKSKKTDKKAETESVVPPPELEVKTSETRLKELDELKKQGLVNKKEYEEKRKEILKEL